MNTTYFEFWGQKIPTGEKQGEATHHSFWVGSICQGATEVAAPDSGAPSYIRNISGSSEVISFSWGYGGDTPTCLPDRFEGDIADDESFTTNAMDIVIDPGLQTHGTSEHPLERCHWYYWLVRGVLNEEPGPWSHAWLLGIGPMENCTARNTPIRPIGAIEAVANQDSACRVGPSTAYGIAGYVAAGERHAVIGRNAEGTWFTLDLGCYISRILVELEVGGTPFVQPVQGGTPDLGGADVGDLMSLIPEIPDPPLPTPTTEEKCSSGMSAAKCRATGGVYNHDLKQCVCP